MTAHLKLLAIFTVFAIVSASPTWYQLCKNPSIRREWGNFTKEQRRNYIDAVLCLQSKPSQLPTGLVPGARNRHDDFVATHINQTSSIHLDGIFLAWHRNFVWLWESALRDECGYDGYQPYWDWSLWQSRGKLSESPLFDGSETSLGGDGYPSDSYNCTPIGVWPNGTGICMPKANGGGCMMQGPFVNSTANLGPFEFSQAFTGLPQNWTAYNPRCLSRDLNDDEAQFLSYSWYDYALDAPTISDFQDRLSNTSSNNGGVHAVGHYVVGHAMWDFFASPYDPSFFLHHGGIDRIWTRWQAIDEQARVYGGNALFGTSTILNGNSTPPVTFDTVLNWGYLGQAKTLGQLMSPTADDFCYVYDG